MKTPIYALALLFFPFIFPQHVEAQEAKSLLWEISGNGLSSPSYLYGTMHVADKRVFKFSKSVMPSFEKCGAYAMELDPGATDPMAMLEMMKLKEGTLQDLFTAEQWDKLDGYFQDKYKQPLSTYNAFSPFFIYSLVLQSQVKNGMGEALDLYFYNQAKEVAKDLYGLETAEEQISAINTMSSEDLVKMLMESIEGKNDGKKEMKKMLKIYMKGDLEKMSKLAEDAELGDDFESELIVLRNHRMAERLQPLIRKKATFVAVGALHLPGDEGVISLLRKDGYTVEALK